MFLIKELLHHIARAAWLLFVGTLSWQFHRSDSFTLYFVGPVVAGDACFLQGHNECNVEQSHVWLSLQAAISGERLGWKPGCGHNGVWWVDLCFLLHVRRQGASQKIYR